MTEIISGPPPTIVLVGADPEGIFAGDPPDRDVVRITNNTFGTVVFVSDSDAGSRQLAIRAGETRDAEFNVGQLYAFARTTSDEEVESASIEVRPIFVTSPLERELSTLLAGLAQGIAISIPTACGAEGFILDVRAIAGTDLRGLNAPPVNLRQFDVSGRTLQARFTQPTGGALAITPILVEDQRIVRVEFENIPRSPVKFAVVAILDADEDNVLGLFGGTVQGD